MLLHHQRHTLPLVASLWEPKCLWQLCCVSMCVRFNLRLEHANAKTNNSSSIVQQYTHRQSGMACDPNVCRCSKWDTQIRLDGFGNFWWHHWNLSTVRTCQSINMLLWPFGASQTHAMNDMARPHISSMRCKERRNKKIEKTIERNHLHVSTL